MAAAPVHLPSRAAPLLEAIAAAPRTIQAVTLAAIPLVPGTGGRAVTTAVLRKVAGKGGGGSINVTAQTILLLTTTEEVVQKAALEMDTILREQNQAGARITMEISPPQSVLGDHMRFLPLLVEEDADVTGPNQLGSLETKVQVARGLQEFMTTTTTCHPI